MSPEYVCQSQRSAVTRDTKLRTYPEEAMDPGDRSVSVDEIVDESPRCPLAHLPHVACGDLDGLTKLEDQEKA